MSTEFPLKKMSLRKFPTEKLSWNHGNDYGNNYGNDHGNTSRK